MTATVHPLHAKNVPSANFWQSGKSTNKAFRDRGNPGPNLANLANLHTARMRARDAVRNTPFAARSIDLDVTNIVGTGIVPRFDDRGLADLWRTWEEQCDASGVHDTYGLQESAVRAWRESGEVFIRMRPRRLTDGLAVPLQLEILEADMVPLENFPVLSNGNRIIQGVEFDRINRRVAYWMHRQHPGERVGLRVDFGELVRVPADRVIHLFEPMRPGQVRGFPPLATVLQRIQQISDYDEATLERQKLASSLTAIFTRPEPGDDGLDPVTGEKIDGREMADIEPGSGYTLLPGEDVEFPNLPSLGGDYEAFSRVNGRAIAAGMGQPYELLTGDFQSMSDRTARVVINEYRRRVEQHQWHRVVRQMMRPIKDAFVEAGNLAGIVANSVSDSVRWVPPAWPYFHPVQDVQALALEVKNGLRSQSDVIHSRGNDPDQVRRERAAEQADDKAAGVFSNTTVHDPAAEQARASARADRIASAEVKEREAQALRDMAARSEHLSQAETNTAAAEAERAEARAHEAEEAMNRSAEELNQIQAEIARERAEAEASHNEAERQARLAQMQEAHEKREAEAKAEADARLDAAVAAADEAREARAHAKALQAEDLEIKQLERQGAEQALADLQQ